MSKRIHVYFSGQVKGIGLPYSARNFATELGLTGWVFNTSEGLVEIEIEGEPANIDQFLQKMKKQFGEHISDIQTKELLAGDDKEFVIKNR
jgi:acylphosphatase